ncbi:ATP-binding protein [Buchananella hordeovulneris]|uniref:ATP-binding protein n=1 Tax=Buchananella hordeovulneris TaxID=52770 RepID=UPI000F5F5B13|nr:ATP-binding protein [Buchananella hordeovulneris]RRD52238.1 ATP-binding protein [Buchananella hordeovulneris]
MLPDPHFASAAGADAPRRPGRPAAGGVGGPGPTTGPRPPLVRPRQGRVLAGVAAGLAVHLQVGVRQVRVVLLGLGVVGIGLVAYLWLWLFVPEDDGRPPLLAPSQQRLAARLYRVETDASPQRLALVVGCGLLVLAGTIWLGWEQVSAASQWLAPAGLVLTGAIISWTHLGRGRRGAAHLAPLAGGLLLAVVGLVLLVSRGRSLTDLVDSLVVGVTILVGTAAILTPTWLRMLRDLTASREAQAREVERADIAAHLHDSVLQTLTLIRTRAGDAETVARLARAQERELREWLYAQRPEAGTSLASELQRLAAEAEDRYGAVVEVVTVGDIVPGAWWEPLAGATREALANAVRHGAPPFSLYCEVEDAQVTVFVRDHGPGFEMSAVPADRHGVRESILQRVERHGGRAQVRRRAPGTEVMVQMPSRQEAKE